MQQLFDSIVQVFFAVCELLAALGAVLLPWFPLIAWVAFWLCAVNWNKLSPILWRKGGFIGVLLLGLVMIMIWGAIAPPAGGTHDLFGLRLSNFVGKTVFVTALICIAFVCGSVQLSGACDRWCRFEEETADEAPPGH